MVRERERLAGLWGLIRGLLDPVTPALSDLCVVRMMREGVWSEGASVDLCGRLLSEGVAAADLCDDVRLISKGAGWECTSRGLI